MRYVNLLLKQIGKRCKSVLRQWVIFYNQLSVWWVFSMGLIWDKSILFTFLRIYQLLTLHLTAFRGFEINFMSIPNKAQLGVVDVVHHSILSLKLNFISKLSFHELTHLIYQNWSDNLLTHLNTLFWDVEVVGHKQYFLHTLTHLAVLDVQSFRSNLDQMVVIQFPYLKSTMLCSKLSKGIGHNYYGEPAWPNDILYIFPIVICGIILQLLDPFSY